MSNAGGGPTTRDELIDAGTRAIRGDWPTPVVAAAVVDAVEPLIRAGLRAKVMALPCPILGSPHSLMGVAHDCVVKRADVLALIDGADR